MRAAFFDPYLDTVGGGERYVLTAAIALRDKGWQVELQWKNSKIIEYLQERLGLDLSGIEIVENISKGAGYDLVFWLSDGSVPLLFAKQNFIHFQTPFTRVAGKNVLNRLKFLKIDKVITNSKFTKNVIDQEFGIDSTVLYPPVSVSEFKQLKKENIILSVGRFSQLQQAKRQDILVQAFKEMVSKRKIKGWELYLVGGSEVGGEEFVRELKKESRGYPIKILENVPFDQIKQLYGKAKIFWSASGFNINSENNPEKVEHFGITTIEAMSAGIVPVVVDNGGHRETIKDGVNGFLWRTIDQIQDLSLDLMKDERRRAQIAKEAKKSAENYSEDKFKENFLKLLV